METIIADEGDVDVQCIGRKSNPGLAATGRTCHSSGWDCVASFFGSEAQDCEVVMTENSGNYLLVDALCLCESNFAGHAMSSSMTPVKWRSDNASQPDYSLDLDLPLRCLCLRPFCCYAAQFDVPSDFENSFQQNYELIDCSEPHQCCLENNAVGLLTLYVASPLESTRCWYSSSFNVILSSCNLRKIAQGSRSGHIYTFTIVTGSTFS